MRAHTVHCLVFLLPETLLYIPFFSCLTLIALGALIWRFHSTNIGCFKSLLVLLPKHLPLSDSLCVVAEKLGLFQWIKGCTMWSQLGVSQLWSQTKLHQINEWCIRSWINVRDISLDGGRGKGCTGGQPCTALRSRGRKIMRQWSRKKRHSAINLSEICWSTL